MTTRKERTEGSNRDEHTLPIENVAGAPKRKKKFTPKIPASAAPEDYYRTYKQILTETWDFGFSWKLLRDWRQLLAELLGTMILVFVGTAVVIGAITRHGLNAASIVAIGLAFGIVVAAMVYTTGNISGGHLNPSITVGFMVVAKIPLIKGLLYIGAQVVGAIIGSALVKGAIPNDLAEFMKYGANAVNTKGVWMHDNVESPYVVLIGQAVLLEIIFGFAVVLTVLSTVKLHRDPNHQNGFAPLAIGLIILVCHLVGVPFTGTSLNPARSFGPAVLSGYWDDHWVWWVGPICGGIIAGLIYKYLLIVPANAAE